MLGLISKSEAVTVGSLAEIDSAFSDVFSRPADSKLIQLKESSDSDSDSDSSDSDTESDGELIQMREDDEAKEKKDPKDCDENKLDKLLMEGLTDK